MNFPLQIEQINSHLANIYIYNVIKNKKSNKLTNLHIQIYLYRISRLITNLTL